MVCRMMLSGNVRPPPVGGRLDAHNPWRGRSTAGSSFRAADYGLVIMYRQTLGGKEPNGPVSAERNPAGSAVRIGDDASDDLPRLHGPERVVDLAERDAAAHHVAEVEAAGLGQADEAGEVIRSVITDPDR